MAGTILPSEADGRPRGWSRDHLRLHRSLLRHPSRLPRGASLLLAVSGGQDSMAMAGLLQHLQPLHGWRLRLWHGDHGWRADSAQQAEELAAWAGQQRLPLRVQRLEPGAGDGNREQAARRWRYACLLDEALQQGCSHVLTAHTGSDRAETVLLHLARGSHRRGLASLRSSLPLAAIQPPGERASNTSAGEPGPLLVRPLQLFCRQDTARICRLQAWPVWPDPTNEDPSLSRNRIRQEVLPVLEALHPGASRRISAQAERLADELLKQRELIALALQTITAADDQLDRCALQRLDPANQRLLLLHWREQQQAPTPASHSLDQLLSRLPLQRGPGRLDLPNGWQLRWSGSRLALQSPDLADGHG
jgi:tRNA(Ile)-lysidine synthase